MRNKGKRVKQHFCPCLFLVSTLVLNFQCLSAAHRQISVLLTALQCLPFLKCFPWGATILSAGLSCVLQRLHCCNWLFLTEATPAASLLRAPGHLNPVQWNLCVVNESCLSFPAYWSGQSLGFCKNIRVENAVMNDSWTTTMEHILYIEFNSLSLTVQISIMIWWHSDKLTRLIDQNI